MLGSVFSYVRCEKRPEIARQKGARVEVKRKCS